MSDKKFRIFILGAGFSKPAGIPLADELWKIILKKSNSLWGRASKFNDDLKSYIQYRYKCDGIRLTRDSVNFEEFLGYLDIEHFLGLRGSDTWSQDGNEGQVVVKKLIGEILTQHMPNIDDIPELYIEFANHLQPNDYILTFNYDTLLERSLEAVGKPYRLYPHRYESVSDYGGTIDSSKDEVIILKLHGSIDWFSKKGYLNFTQTYIDQGIDKLPDDIIFNSKDQLTLTKLIDCPYYKQDPLNDMYRVVEIEKLYKKQLLFLATPWILTPSTNKIVYASPLGEFWSGLGVSGGFHFGMAIIGYSMPAHDIYAKQTIYSLVKNYQTAFWDNEKYGYDKTPLILVDLKSNQSEIDNYKQNYRFVDYSRAELYMDGFNMKSIEKLFQ